jgi:hypothetical protein
MAETPEDLQKQLNIFHDYYLAWKLKVNIDKTKKGDKFSPCLLPLSHGK